MSAGTPLWLWAVVSAAILAVVVAFRVRPWKVAEPSLGWFVAAAGSAAVLVLTAARVIESLPGISASRLGVLAAAGALTGALLGIGLTPRERRSA
jgi:hypothetical protein